jgi:hypothetical protein
LIVVYILSTKQQKQQQQHLTITRGKKVKESKMGKERQGESVFLSLSFFFFTPYAMLDEK